MTCDCGCGGIPKGRLSEFLPGHDATHRKNLNAAIIAGWEAQVELHRRGWSYTDDVVACLVNDPAEVASARA